MLLWLSTAGVAAQVSENHTRGNQGSTPATEISQRLFVSMNFKEVWRYALAFSVLLMTTDQSSPARIIGPYLMGAPHNHKLTESRNCTFQSHPFYSSLILVFFSVMSYTDAFIDSKIPYNVVCFSHRV